MSIPLFTRNANDERVVVDVPETSDLPPAERGTYDIAQYSLVGQNGNAENATADLTTIEREDTNWSAAVHSGGADHVEIHVTAAYDYESGDANQTAEARVSPILKLFKNGVLVEVSASAYQRQATGHNDSSNNIYYMDVNPSPTGDTYSVEFQQGSTQNDVMLITQGHFTLKAIY